MSFSGSYYNKGARVNLLIYIWFIFITLIKTFVIKTRFLLLHCGPTRVMTSSFLRSLDHTQRRTTVGRTPLDEWSAHLRDLYLTTHSSHKRQTSIPPVGFEPTISSGQRPQTLHLRPLGNWDRLLKIHKMHKIYKTDTVNHLQCSDNILIIGRLGSF